MTHCPSPFGWCYHHTDVTIFYIQGMFSGPEFFTATCLNWQPLLAEKEHKDIVLESLHFLVREERIWIYVYVIMPDRIHLLWRKQDGWIDKSIQQQFFKFTAQQIKFNLLQTNPKRLEMYKSSQSDRQYHFWERRPYKATMFTREVLEQIWIISISIPLREDCATYLKSISIHQPPFIRLIKKTL